eukprot:363506-Chlamydomonas_euryale.AAC.3
MCPARRTQLMAQPLANSHLQFDGGGPFPCHKAAQCQGHRQHHLSTFWGEHMRPTRTLID